MHSNQGYCRYFAISILFASMLFARENNLLANSSSSFFYEQSNGSSNVTSLMNSAMDGDSVTTQVLINSGADVNAKNIGGATALHIAARMNNVDIIETLIKNGAKIDVKDNDGWTPLMRASLAGNKESVDVLLDNGASIWLENRWDESALIHASVSNCKECMESFFKKVDFSGIDEKELIKVNKQIDESIAISKKKKNVDIEKNLTLFSEKVNKKETEIDDGEKKIYKLKDNEKIVEPGVLVESGSECTIESKDGSKICDEAKIEVIETENLENEEQKINYSFTGKKIEKVKKNRRAIVDEPVISEDKNKIGAKDSKEGAINLNSENWKSETKKEFKENIEQKTTDTEEKVENGTEEEVEKLFIFTGDKKGKNGSLPKKSSQVTPTYENDFNIQKYDAEIFEEELEESEEEVINLNEKNSNQKINFNKPINKMEKVYIFSGEEKSL